MAYKFNFRSSADRSILELFEVREQDVDVMVAKWSGPQFGAMVHSLSQEGTWVADTLVEGDASAFSGFPVLEFEDLHWAGSTPGADADHNVTLRLAAASHIPADNVVETFSWDGITSFLSAQQFTHNGVDYVPIEIFMQDSVFLQSGTPVIISYSSTASSAILVWRAVPYADTYLLECSTDDAFLFPTRFSDATYGGYNVSGLAANTMYYWRVKAIGTGENNDSEWSGIVSFRTNSTEVEMSELQKIIFKNNAFLEATPSENQHITNKTYVDSAISTSITNLHLATTYAPAMHTHAANEITTGVFASARIPVASSSSVGGIKIGTGLVLTDGVASVDIVATIAATSTETTVPSAFAVYTWATDTFAPAVHTHEANQVNGLGTAALLNTGTSSGTIPVLDANGKLADSIIPKIAIGNVYTVTDATAMNALVAEEGDVAIRSDESKTYIKNGDGNWISLATPTDAVASVNGKTGTVVLASSDVGAIDQTALVTSVAFTSTDATVPSALSVYTFVNTNYAAKVHTHSADDINTGTLTPDRLPVATSSAYGAVKITTSANYSTTNDEAATTMAAVADYTATTMAATRYDGTIVGDGTTTEFTITHNLGARDVFSRIIDAHNNLCIFPIEFISSNAFVVKFYTAPAAAENFRVVVRS